MATYSLVNDRISLSALDVHILVSLLEGQNNGYELARSSAVRMARTTPISRSNVYKSLVALQKMMLVAGMVSTSTNHRNKMVYRISSLGRMMLETEIAEQAKFIGIAQTLLEETAAIKNPTD